MRRAPGPQGGGRLPLAVASADSNGLIRAPSDWRNADMAPAAQKTSSNAVTIDVWSDVMCPFCWMGETLLQQAAEASGHELDIRYHSYQLMPHLPADSAVNVNDLLERERGFPREQALAMNRQVAARAAQVGLVYNMDDAIATNTRSAHRLAHFAKQRGKQHELMQQLFKAYLTDGLNIGDHEVLADLAAEVGLDRAAALEALKTDAFAAEFDADVEEARRLGISGVPFFVLNGKYAVSGAQPREVFEQALAKASAEV